MSGPIAQKIPVFFYTRQIHSLHHTTSLYRRMYMHKETVLNKSSAETGINPLVLQLREPQDVRAVRDKEADNIEDKHYLEHVATAGGIVTRTPNFPHVVSWRVLKQWKVLELELMDLKMDQSATVAQTTTRKIRLHSPLPMQKDCITVVEDGDAVVVDFITETTGYLYTVRVPIEEFSLVKTKLTEQNSQEWRSIKRPGSFDMKPVNMMHAVNANVLIAALKDGTYTKMVRADAVGTVDPSSFQDQQQSSFSRFLPWNHSDKVPHADMSVRTAVSMASIGNVLATVSINRRLRLWDLNTCALIGEQLVSDVEQLLNPTPAQLIDASDNYLVTYVPLEDGKFRIFDQKMEMMKEIDAKIPDTSNAVWVVADVKVVEFHNKLKLWVCWKSDTSSSIQTLDIPFKSSMGEWIQVQSGDNEQYHSHNHKFSKTDSRDESEYYLQKVFGPGGFSLQTLKTALPIYAQHFSLPVDHKTYRTISKLKQAVCETVGAAVSMSGDSYGNNDYKAYQQDLSLQWARFERLCGELEKQGQEALALSCSRDEVMVLKSTFVSVIREMTQLEVFYYNRNSNPAKKFISSISQHLSMDPDDVESVLKLMDTLKSFRQSISHNVMAGLHGTFQEDYTRIRHNFATSERIVEYYEEHFEPHLTDYAIGVLATQLADIQDLDSVISIVGLLVEGAPDQSTSRHKITNYGAQYLCKSLFELSNIAQQCTLDILSLVVMSSCNDDLVQEETTSFARHLAQLKSVECIQTCLNIEQPASAQTFMEDLVLSGTLHTPVQLWSELTSHTSAAQLAVQMSERKIAHHDFINDFVPYDYFGVFIRGLLQLEERWICKASVGMSGAVTVSPTQHSIIRRVSQDLIVGKGVCAFYESCARYVTAFDPLLGLKLAKLAVQAGDVQTNLKAYESWFDIAVQVRAFDDIYAALVDLQFESQSEDYLYQKVSTLVDVMIKDGGGNGASKLCQYPFIGLRHHVTRSLENNHDLRILYSWRIEHGDHRGAAAALYNEIQRLRAVPGLAPSSPEYDQVRYLYESVLNSLKIVPQDDQWIVVDGVQDHDAVMDSPGKRVKTEGDTESKGYRFERRAMKYADVEKEYHGFLAGLESKLKHLVI